MPVILLFLLFTVTSRVAVSQYFSVGNDPSGIRWRQIECPDFKIIYPDYYESRAKEFAAASKDILPHVSGSLFLKPKPFRVVVHPESIQSNGWAMWVPRKIELAPMPALYNMAENDSDHLLIHEYRHIVQLDKLDKGLTRVLGWFLGDQAAASVQALHIPDWVSEGDAVLTETILSHSGRGRSPLFLQGMKALILSENKYKFDKARFGSYRDFIPDYYVFGYNMVSMARLLDNEFFWSDVHDNVARKPYRISNFNRLLHKRTGLWQGGLFKETSKYLSEFWKTNSKEIGAHQIRLLIEDSSDYYSYLKPYPESDSTWICLKKSYANLPSVVRIKADGSEDHVFYTGSINRDSYSYSSGLLAWAQQIADPRWEMRSFSDVFLYDIHSGKRKRLTRNERYLYPVLDPGADAIACVEERTDGSCSIIILNIEGKVDRKLDAPAGCIFRQPVWGGNGENIYALMTSRKGKKLVKWNIKEPGFEEVLDFGFKEVNQLEYANNEIVFTAPIGTVQGLYAYNPVTETIKKLIVNDFGLGYPAVNDGKIGISVNTAEGYRPAEIKWNSDYWEVAEQVDDLQEPFLSEMRMAENESPVDYGTMDTSWISSTRYSKVGHLFNVHSWAPVYLDVDNYGIRPGAMLMSQNDLNTLTSSFGVLHNKQARSIDYFADLKYSGWYPDIGLNLLAGKRRADTLLLNQDTIKDARYFELESRLSLAVPMFFSQGAYYQRIHPYFFLSHHKYYNGHSSDEPGQADDAFELSYASATLGLAGQVMRRMSYRDLYPRWGFTSGIQAEAGIANPEIQAYKRLSGYIRFYTPGILKNHSLRTYAGISIQDKYALPQLPFVSLPRGHYEAANYNYSSYKMDYSFPIAYPDWSIPSFLYITRFKANLFADGAHMSTRDEPWSFKTGIDLSSNFYFLRIGVELDAGVRVIFDPMDKTWDFEFLYSFDIE